jgi:CIC family chloride channel protein
MTTPVKTAKQIYSVTQRWVRPHLASFFALQQPRLWLLAILLGAIGGALGIAFRLAIGFVQSLWLGTASEQVLTTLSTLPWWWPMIGPVGGGIVVGIILYFWRPLGRAGGVADVIEARVRESSALTFRGATVATLVTAITLGSGGSGGREGPIVYYAAAASKLGFRIFRLPAAARRIALACGVAAAISSSFNAPIAGVLFAHEVILGHFAMSAFVPLVIASVVAAIISRLWFGEAPAFVIDPDAITISSYLEIPAFALLGLVCAAVAILFQTALIGGDWLSKRSGTPVWVRPAIGGLLVGLIALAFPHVLGVGYEATDMALAGSLDLWLMLALIVAKTVATTITLSSRAGGGVFSPCLYLGAMTGGAFGIIATSVFPDVASSVGLYALIGMGAVAAAVLGAPISTAVMIFELTGGFAFSIALLLAVAIATGLTQAVMGRSYFHWQLYTRGIMLEEGPHKHAAQFIRVRDFLRPLPEDQDNTFDIASGAPWLRPTETLESALKAFDASEASRLPVIETKTNTIIGHAHHVDALSSFNKALVAHSREEHS